MRGIGGFLALLAAGFSLSAQAEPLTVKLFTAPAWCPPCQALERFLKSENLLNPGAAVRIEVIDIDQDPRPSERASQGVPELQLFDGDRRISVHNGGFGNRAEWDAWVMSKAAATQPSGFAGMAPAAAPLPIAPPSNTVRTIQPVTKRELLGENAFSKRLGIPASAALLIGTGRNAAENPISVGLTLRDAKRALTGPLRVPASGLLTMYGSGVEAPEEAEAYERLADAQPQVAHVTGVQPDASFTRANLLGAMKAMYDQRVRNALIVLAGHGAPEGIQHWAAPGTGVTPPLDPETLRKFILASQIPNTVIVSGNCFGGRFAQAASCGFFAARPDRAAAGCSPDASQRLTPGEGKDYLAIFFRTLSTPGTTFAEAHWRATAFGEAADAPYSSIDALVDRHFASHPHDSRPSISRDEVLGLRSFANVSERRAYDMMITPWFASVASAKGMNLTGLAQRADTKAAQLVRRLLLRRLASRGELAADTLSELRKLDTCENQSPAAFFAAPAFAAR